MVIPDADGIGAYEKWRANLLAAIGYVGFVPDIYGNKVKQVCGTRVCVPCAATCVCALRVCV